MPTNLRRHSVTEDDELQAYLDVARAAWPDETSPTRLMRNLMSEGVTHLSETRAEVRARRRRNLESIAERHPWPGPPAERHLAEIRAAED